MKKIFPALTALALIVSMSSCSKQEIVDKNEGLASLKFRVTTGKVTRANSGEINDMTSKTITVFVKDASTGAPATVIDGDNGGPISTFSFDWDGSTATTTPSKIYLPADANLTFVAFSNTSASHTFTAGDFTFDGTEITIDDFDSEVSAETVYAISAVNINSGSATVDFIFNHIVSQLMFAVAKNDADLDIEITALDVAEVPVSGTFTGSVSGGSFSTTGITYADYTLAQMDAPTDQTTQMSSASATPSTDEGTITRNSAFASFFVVPCLMSSLTDDSEINVTYNIKDGSVSLITGATATIKFKNLTGITSWAPGKRHIYTFKPGTFIANPTISVDITSWADENIEEIEAY